MLYKVSYSDLNDRQAKLDANKDKFLVEEDTISEGNFLIFSDSPRLEDAVQQLKENSLILMDALATTFEQVLALEAKIDAMGGSV